MKTRPQETPDWTKALEHEARMLLEILDAHPIARLLFDGIIGVEGYASWLIQSYHYVKWTTPILEAAGQRMKRLRVHPPLADLLLQKASEERGHERWLLADLRQLGWSRERVERQAPCLAVETYVAWNRFTAEVGTPTGYLGTAYVLESLSVHRAEASVKRLIAHGAIPCVHKAVTFLRGHGEADGDHTHELLSVLRALSDPEEQEAILLSARTTRELYPGLFLTRDAQGLSVAS